MNMHATDLDESNDQAIYSRACELLRNPEILTSALNGQCNPRIQALIESSSLTGLVLADDEQTFGRALLDSVIEYVMETADEQLNDNRCRQ